MVNRNAGIIKLIETNGNKENLKKQEQPGQESHVADRQKE